MQASRSRINDTSVSVSLCVFVCVCARVCVCACKSACVDCNRALQVEILGEIKLLDRLKAAAQQRLAER